MKRRGVFKKTVNRQQSNEQRAMSNEQYKARNAGEFYCGVWEGYVSLSVCIVRATRNHCECEAACPKREAA